MKDLSFEQLVRASEMAEHVKQFDVARSFLNDALEKLDPIADRVHYGALLLNLGGVERQSGNHEAAVKAYAKAAELLDGQNGDAILQRAHAFFSISEIRLLKDKEAAYQTSTQALDLYRKYPFTEAKDLIDANVIVILSGLATGRIQEAKPVIELWSEVKATPIETLQIKNLIWFLSTCWWMHSQGQFPEMSLDIVAWLGDTRGRALIQQLEKMN